MTNDRKFSHSIAELSERPEHDTDNTINSITSVLDSETLASHEGTARRMTYIIIMAPARDCQPSRGLSLPIYDEEGFGSILKSDGRIGSAIGAVMPFLFSRL